MATRRPPARPRAQKQCVDCEPGSKRKTPHPGPRCATHHRSKRRERSSGAWGARILATYGITPDEYWQIYEHQGGRCYICQRANGKVKRLSVDHDHKTGIVRGLLCTMCNKYTLGWARDAIEFFERAIAYLKRPPAVEVLGERIAPIEADKLIDRP
ncbi:endonuclease VII [Mycobacterium phage DarthPhader]|uniref:Endonuclease VII n=1 Tax=Mycobacterium phage DarthPhader TaxID=1912975 RepID=A0A1I9S405_9CAUD|nr:endonuclease VII [Mycobacterium phage DarthPhader]AOZ61299.1 endonuclease VII [Mycobacterium phage DarthPhader]